MDQDVAPKANAPGGPASQPDRSGQPNDADRHVEPRSDTDTDIEQLDGDVAEDNAVDAADHARDERITRVVHIVLGLVIAGARGVAALSQPTQNSHSAVRTASPGPAIFPVLLTICSDRVWDCCSRCVWLVRRQRLATGRPRPCRCTRADGPGAAGVGRARGLRRSSSSRSASCSPVKSFLLVIMAIERIRSIPLIVTLLLLPPAMYLLFDTLLEVQLPGGTLWY